MSDSDRRIRAQASITLSALTAGILAVGCQHSMPASNPAPRLPQEPVVAPAPIDNPAVRAAALDTAREKHIDIDTHGTETDVRTLLDFIANAGGFSLVYSPDIKKRVRMTLNDVPVSIALQTVLSLADLTIESATPNTKIPGSTSVVFYQLPVNVDSLSADAIMKRFGVSRGVAEMLVQSRLPRTP